jgi:RNA polymerase sigma-70 factor (ECF subfamily)
MPPFLAVSFGYRAMQVSGVPQGDDCKSSLSPMSAKGSNAMHQRCQHSANRASMSQGKRSPEPGHPAAPVVTGIRPRGSSDMGDEVRGQPARFEMDLATERWTWSPSLFAVLGLSKALRPSTGLVISTMHPDDRPLARRMISEAVDFHRPFCDQSRVVRDDGLLRKVESSGNVVVARNGSLRAISGTFEALSNWEVPWFDESRADLLSDGDLSVTLRARVEDAYAYVFRRNASAVARASRRFLRDGAQVDDVVQNVFEELWRHPSRFDPERSSLSTYLQLQARNRSIDLVRSESSRLKRGCRSTLGVASSSEDDFIASTSDVRVRHVLDLLAARERESIELALFGDMTYKEVAAYLGIPEGTSKSRIRSGLNRLRLLIRATNRGPDDSVTDLIQRRGARSRVRPTSNIPN